MTKNDGTRYGEFVFLQDCMPGVCNIWPTEKSVWPATTFGQY